MTRSGGTSRIAGTTMEFERFVVVLLFSFGFFHMIYTYVMGEPELLPTQVTVSTSLCLILYLWLSRTRQLNTVVTMGKQLEECQVQTIGALVEAIEAKDPYVGGHSRRVSHMASELARHMGLPGDKVLTVARAGLLHDIGKLGISDSILHKAAPLTADEWSILKNHPQRTYEILAGLSFLEEASRLALLHHERHDGQGYATGLSGDEIPVEAAILAVADAFDAMNSDRSYRKRLEKTAILAELEKGRNAQHAGPVVQALLELLHAKPELWSRA